MNCCQTVQPLWPAHTEVVPVKFVLICRVYSFGPRMPPPPNAATPTLFSDVTPVTVGNVPSVGDQARRLSDVVITIARHFRRAGRGFLRTGWTRGQCLAFRLLPDEVGIRRLEATFRGCGVVRHEFTPVRACQRLRVDRSIRGLSGEGRLQPEGAHETYCDRGYDEDPMSELA